MRFCPECNFNLNITKILSKKTISNIINIDNSDTFINLVLNNNSELENNIKILFSKNSLTVNPKFTKLNSKSKEQILKQYEKFSSNIDVSNGYFICHNCGYYSNINPGTIIYSSGSNKLEEKNNYSLLCQDKTLPRTKDYICVNKSCKSHDKSNDKEAVFYRSNTHNYQLNYICCICKTHWKNHY